MADLKGVAVGAGYFSQFHYDAWSRISEAEIVAVCDLDAARADGTCRQFGIPRSYTGYEEMLDAERPDFVDIITRPETHAELCAAAAERGIAIICQKPLAPSFAEARSMVAAAERAGVRLMVHENFRFQPWHREIRRLLDSRVIGDTLHALSFRSRPGDGWGADAYAGRQPYFREMPRLLVYETGIHFIDTFRYLAGEVRRVDCRLRRLNPVIAGEDCGLLLLEFENEALGLWDANRFNESRGGDPRYTFGEFLVEASGGTLRLALDGSLSVQPLGEAERPHDYHHERRGFAGDCVLATQLHFVKSLLWGQAFETEGHQYLKNLVIQEACYASNERRSWIDVAGMEEELANDTSP